MINFRMKCYVYAYSVLLNCIFLCVFSGCFKAKDDIVTGEQIYASVNGVNLTESELRAIVPVEFYDKLTDEHKREIVREWVSHELLYQEALRLGIDRELEIARILKNSERNLLSTELLERKLADVPIPSEEELKEYYEEHKDYFILQSNEYKVRYALFDNLKDAQNFWSKVKKGASFSELAKKESEDPSSSSGGDIGIINEELMEPAIWEAIVNTYETLGLRKISNPFSVIDGFGIVIVDEILRMGTVKPFDAAREQVVNYYIVEKREEAKKSLLAELEAEAAVEYNIQ